MGQEVIGRGPAFPDIELMGQPDDVVGHFFNILLPPGEAGGQVDDPGQLRPGVEVAVEAAENQGVEKAEAVFEIQK